MLHFSEDATAREGDASPALRREDVSLQDDAEEHREDLPRRRDGRADKRVEVGDGVKDEALSDGAADAELDHLVEDGRVLRDEGESSLELSEGDRDDNRGAQH